jgi:hypothetical protein
VVAEEATMIRAIIGVIGLGCGLAYLSTPSGVAFWGLIVCGCIVGAAMVVRWDR